MIGHSKIINNSIIYKFLMDEKNVSSINKNDGLKCIN
jgi:hypothetical protein